MEFDLMARASTWADAANLAKRLEGADFSGMLVTEASQVPWMMIAAAAMSLSSVSVISNALRLRNTKI